MIVAFLVFRQEAGARYFFGIRCGSIFRVNEVVEPDLSALAQHHTAVPAAFCLHHKTSSLVLWQPQALGEDARITKAPFQRES